MGKILTIIIPAYNMEKYLNRCLSSLIVTAEKMELLEVLVINDGSKDKTSEIGHAFEDRYPGTFRVIDKTNGHYGSCINRGLDEASGSYVKILDADDTFDPKVLSLYLEFISRICVSEEPIDVILSDYIQVDEELHLLSEHRFGDYKGVFTLGQLSKADTDHWFIHGLAYRTKNLRDIRHRQTEGIPYTDIEWCFYPASTIHRAIKFNGFLYRYTKLRDEQSVAPAVHGKNIDKQTRIIRKIILDSPQLMARVTDPETSAFLESFKANQVFHIYQLFLVSLSKYIKDDSILSDFDVLLKEHDPSLYDRCSKYKTTIAGIPFRPVLLWRNGEKASLHCMQFLYRVINKYNQVKVLRNSSKTDNHE